MVEPETSNAMDSALDELERSQQKAISGINALMGTSAASSVDELAMTNSKAVKALLQDYGNERNAALGSLSKEEHNRMNRYMKDLLKRVKDFSSSSVKGEDRQAALMNSDSFTPYEKKSIELYGRDKTLLGLLDMTHLSEATLDRSPFGVLKMLKHIP